MSGLFIDKSLCIGCGACAGACPQAALSLEADAAEVNAELCVLCGICVNTCPVSAISIRKESAEDIQNGQWRGVWVCAEYLEGRLDQSALELLGKAGELACELECETAAVIIGGNEAEKCAESLAQAGADRVLAITGRDFEAPIEEVYASALTELISRERPEILLFAATEFGRSLAPRVAAALGTGLTADCTLLEADTEARLLKQTRPAFGGNLMATIICPDRRPQMATVRPGVLPLPELDISRVPRLERVDARPRFKGKELLGMIRRGEGGASITGAKVLVTAGRGIGSKKELALVRRLAELLGGDYGVTRPLVDLGWAEYPHQVGQTGCTVAPELLITCGVSGAIQHLAGISGAKTVIAINTDPYAPIFSRADYAVVGDCVEVLTELIALLEAES